MGCVYPVSTSELIIIVRGGGGDGGGGIVIVVIGMCSVHIEVRWVFGSR